MINVVTNVSLIILIISIIVIVLLRRSIDCLIALVGAVGEHCPERLIAEDEIGYGVQSAHVTL